MEIHYETKFTYLAYWTALEKLIFTIQGKYSMLDKILDRFMTFLEGQKAFSFSIFVQVAFLMIYFESFNVLFCTLLVFSYCSWLENV